MSEALDAIYNEAMRLLELVNTVETVESVKLIISISQQNFKIGNESEISEIDDPNIWVPTT
jgi:hypothetical protein